MQIGFYFIQDCFVKKIIFPLRCIEMPYMPIKFGMHRSSCPDVTFLR